MSSARSAHGVYQSVSLFPRIFAYDVDFELSKLTTVFLDTDGEGVFPGKLQGGVSVRVPHHNG